MLASWRPCDPVVRYRTLLVSRALSSRVPPPSSLLFLTPGSDFWHRYRDYIRPTNDP
jgi:hypothetical protein